MPARFSEPIVPAVYPISGAARYLGLGSRTLRACIARGEIAVIRLSPRRVGVAKSDLDAYIAANRAGGK